MESSYFKITTVPTCSQSSPPRLWHYEPNLKKEKRTASKDDATTYCGTKCLKPARNRFISVCYIAMHCDFTVFKSNFQHFHFRYIYELHIQGSSNCCSRKLKQSISQNFYSNFWRVFDIWPFCATTRGRRISEAGFPNLEAGPSSSLRYQSSLHYLLTTSLHSLSLTINQ